MPDPPRPPLAAAALATAALVALVSAAALLRPAPTAREVVDDARRAHGSAALDEACVAFAFRGTPFVAARSGGRFAYRMLGADERPLATLTNEGLAVDTLAYEAHRRFPDGTPSAGFRDSVRAHGDAIARSAETTLNSVVYFALLPYNLNDPAVRLRRLGDASFGGRRYRTVEVTFAPDGGGRDHDDRFVYWFDADTRLLGAMAYAFHTGEGGTRFRQVSRVHRLLAGDGPTAPSLVFNDYRASTDTTLGARIEAYPSRLGAPTVQPLPDLRTDAPRLLPTTSPLCRL